jgi:hypothetical protein
VDRCAVFVDAGWLQGEAARALTGRGDRSGVICDPRGLAPALARLAMEHTDLPLLRIYWYDVAPDGIRLDVAALPDVKLRLVGAPAADLLALARERAIASALVISGDGDLREGVAAAQGLGVRVTLAAVAAPEGGPSLPSALVHEADDVLLLGLDLLGAHFRPQPAEAAPAPAAVPVNGANPASGAGAVSGDGAVTTPREFGRRFGAAHAGELGAGDLRALRREAPMLPADVASRLYRDAARRFGALRDRPEVRRELKAGFWDQVMRRR